MRGFCNESCVCEYINTCVAKYTNLSVARKHTCTAYTTPMNNLSDSTVKYTYLCDAFMTVGTEVYVFTTCKVKPCYDFY